MTKKRILWCSQTPSIHTGYGVITHDILLRLAATKKYEIACQGWFEPPAKEPTYPYEGLRSSNFPFKLYHTSLSKEDKTMKDKNGGKTIDAILEDFKPDIVVYFGDIYMVDWILEHPNLKNHHLVSYVPIDGMPVPDKWKNFLQYIDTPLTFSQFGQRVAGMALNRDIEMIYHGIDFGLWSSPLPEEVRSQKRIEMFGSDDVVVFGMVARNQPRKNIPALYEAFSEHIKTHPKSRLLIHACNQDQGWLLSRLGLEFGISDRVYVTPDLHPNRGVPPPVLRLIYGCMDVHVNTAWGEGFGIPIIESMAAGIPNIVPAYTIGPEFIGQSKGGGLIKVASFLVEAGSHIRRAIVDVKHLKETMDKLAMNKAMRTELGRNAQEFAKKFDWAPIIKKWENLFDNIDTETTNIRIRPEEV
jgi:glycosyltransferase involved in cell wall biosynthesis